MNKSKKILLATLLATSMTSAMTSVQADGFFSKLFSSSTEGASFKSLISHVPENTAYFFGNEKAMPDDVLSFHLQRAQELMKMISELEEKNKDKKELTGADKFFKTLLTDISTHYADKKFEATGLSLKPTFMVYGLDSLPIARLGFADKTKLMETIKRAEKESDYKIDFQKCGDYDCFIDEGKDDNLVAMVILKDHIAASLFSKSDKEKVINHIIGKSMPKTAYSLKKWDTFLEDNNYKGYGDGFISLKNLSGTLKPMIMQGFAKKVDPKELEGCLAVAQAHIDNMPEIIMGSKKLEVKNMDYEVVLKTSTDVSNTLQTIANKTNIANRAANPIIDVGVNVNFMKLRDALTQYANFLIKSGEANKCSSIEPTKIRKGMGGLMMAMNMGLTQFKSIYASVSEIELDDQMKPSKVDAYLSIGTDDPAGLLGMVSMMSPKLMGFKLPSDGTAVKLPDGAIPTKGQPLPDIYLSRSDKSLNIMVGNNKPKLKFYKKTVPEITSFSMDMKRYYKKLASIMSKIPRQKGKDEDGEKVIKMMSSIGDMMGEYQQEVIADKRGLVINYHVNYQ